jgi:pimeloyl-ACP methyl ester carboxylesterase
MAIPEIASQTKGSGKPLVLLHAFPLSHVIWKDLNPPSGFQMILPDFPGFGDSPLAGTGLTLAETAQGLKNHLTQKGIDGPLVLGGISMGGYWAMEFLRQFQGLVSRVLLISTKPGSDKPEARQNRLNMADKVMKDGTGYLVEAMAPGLLGRTTLAEKPGVKDQVGRWILATRPEAVALAQRAMAQRRDQTDLLPGLKVPTLVIAGREDALIPASEAEAMAKVIPGSRLRVLEKAGHLVPLEDPSQFQKILDDFMAQPG